MMDHVTVHPRACGEQCPDRTAAMKRRGSSPRMRGTGPPPPRHGWSARFIPAHAGNRRRHAVTLCMSQVHPRACGEQGEEVLHWCRIRGSSPRMRGTAQRAIRGQHPDRFIPAHAGNSHRGRLSGSGQAVHPRACGEQAHLLHGKRRRYGSSPRMRGTVAGHRIGSVQRRFIPAHAGNSWVPAR